MKLIEEKRASSRQAANQAAPLRGKPREANNSNSIKSGRGWKASFWMSLVGWLRSELFSSLLHEMKTNNNPSHEARRAFIWLDLLVFSSFVELAGYGWGPALCRTNIPLYSFHEFRCSWLAHWVFNEEKRNWMSLIEQSWGGMKEIDWWDESWEGNL